MTAVVAVITSGPAGLLTVQCWSVPDDLAGSVTGILARNFGEPDVESVAPETASLAMHAAGEAAGAVFTGREETQPP